MSEVNQIIATPVTDGKTSNLEKDWIISFTCSKHSHHNFVQICALMKTTKLYSHFIATITLKHTLCH